MNRVSIGSDNGLAPNRRQAIIWNSAGLLLRVMDSQEQSSRPQPHVELSFWTFFSQPSLCSTWPCHLNRRVQSTFARSSNCILYRRSCQLTCTFIPILLLIFHCYITPHNWLIIARSLHWRQCKLDTFWAQVSLFCSMTLPTHELKILL